LAKPRKAAAKKAKGKARTPPHSAYPEWSDAKFFGFIRSALRNASSRWPPRYQCLHEARRPYVGTGRQKWEFQCAICQEWHKQKDVAVDHIIPCGSLKSYEDLAGFTQRLFVEKDGLRILCHTCHKEVTNNQRAGQ
jgi:hypothetical protein